MGAQDGVKWLTGYLPEAKLPALREAAAAHGWGVAARDPTDDEDPPTLIDPPKIFRPIVALFDMLGIAPGYREADVSVVFYSFFTIFFAMLVGDVGYGVIEDMHEQVLALLNEMQRILSNGYDGPAEPEPQEMIEAPEKPAEEAKPRKRLFGLRR